MKEYKDTVGIVSILMGKPYIMVKDMWKLFEEKYDSIGVRIFDHPNLTFQAGTTNRMNKLLNDFSEFTANIKLFNVEVDGIGHFEKRVIYLKVRKSKRLIELNKSINDYLTKYCDNTFILYNPENWIPHITLAMDDLSVPQFKKAWMDLKDQKFQFRQTIRNLTIIKLQPDGKVKTVRRFEIGEIDFT